MSLSSNFPTSKPSLNLDFANTKRLDPRVTFTRSTTGTYYDGVTTAKAEENLLTYSEQFDNAIWSKNTVTVTANSTTAPDGTTTADTVTQSAGANVKYLSQLNSGFAGRAYTASIYAKAGTNNFIQFLFGGSNTDFANFDISAGTVGTTLGVSSATITSVGNGWYRCVVTWNSLSTDFTSYAVAVIPSSTSSRAASTSDTNTVFVWGAQLEQRSSVTAYTVTTTQPITNYIPVLLTAAANVPRFDHNPTTDESLGLLIEEQRTNLCLYSEDFTSVWYGPATAAKNVIVSPAGTVTGGVIREATSSQYQRIFQAITVSAGSTYTATIYAKKGLRNWLTIDAGPTAYYNLDTGTVGSVGAGATASMTAVGDGWYRCSYTYANPTTAFSFYVGTSVTGSDGGLFTGTGYDSIYIWGAQVEAGSFATSYIPTTSAAVTRTADLATMTGTNFTSWFNAGAGTFYGEANLSGSGRYFHTVKTGSPAQIEGVQQTTYFEAFVYTTDVQAQINIAAASFINRRVALAYQVNDIAACVSGGAVSVDTNAILPLDLNAFYVNSYGTSGPLGSGTVKKVAYYPARLTNAQLQAITS